MQQNEQIFIDESPDNIDVIHEMLVNEIHDAEYLNYLRVVQSENNIISIKAKSFLACNVKLGKKVSYISFPADKKHYFTNCIIIDSENCKSKILINDVNDIKQYTKPISLLFIDVLFKLGGESFGCCHRYVECSDALKCLHPNLLHSFGCTYKKNLESGKVFYGKNRNE